MKPRLISFGVWLLMAGLALSGCEKTPDGGALQINADALETFAWDGGAQTFFFSSSYDWSAASSDEDWCTINPQSGPGGDHEITVTVQEGSYSSRRATITIRSHGQKKSVEINQQGVIPTVKIPATTGDGFWMGTNNTKPTDPNYYSGISNDSERPVHQVKLSGFRMGITEVTNAQYATFLNAAKIAYSEDLDDLYGSATKCKGCEGSVTVDGVKATYPLLYDCTSIGGGYEPWGITYANGQWVPMTGYANHPVIHVTWYGAKAFCDWLSKETGQSWRLPTEAEWEYACRGNSNTPEKAWEGAWCFGNDNSTDKLKDYAWFGDNNDSGSAHAVGQKDSNGYGLYDMHGNVWEWCYDWFGGSYYSAPPFGGWNNPTGPKTGDFRVIRGGGWFYSADHCRSAYRSVLYPPLSAVCYLGFRVVLVP